ncbi:TPA: hypothetical protein DDW35_07795 [Candidatus Sumerlaeota bacterium]|jgi:Tol biopolymer transport system component|nr:hypothetical protein [Candidatus Sumerlaeota bacterium]
MSRKNRFIRTVCWTALPLMLLMFTGCFWQILSWSPDGRWVAFVVDKDKSDGKEKMTYRCDTHTGETKELPLENRDGWFGKTETLLGDPVSCRYLPKSNALLTVVQYKPKDGGDERWLLYQSKPGSNKCVLLASEAPTVLDVSKDGQRIYYATSSKEKSGDTEQEISRLWEKPLNGSPRLLLQTGDEKANESFPWFGQLSPSGRQFVYAMAPKESSGVAVILNLDKLTTRSIVAAESEKDAILWPMWLDEDNILFLSGASEECGKLHRVSLRTGEQREVCDKEIYYMHPLSLSPDKKMVAVALRENKENKKTQLALVNVESGKVEPLSQLPYAIYHPAFSPDGKRMAFLSTAQEKGRLEILDLATKRSLRSWTNVTEKEFVSAESLVDAGKKSEALKNFSAFLQKHADSPYADLARYYIVRLSSEIPGSDSTLANEALAAIQDNNLKDEATKLAPAPMHLQK